MMFYEWYMSQQLYGTEIVVRSEPLHVKPSVCPNAPDVTVLVVGLEERRRVEKVICDLANKRDR